MSDEVAYLREEISALDGLLSESAATLVELNEKVSSNIYLIIYMQFIVNLLYSMQYMKEKETNEALLVHLEESEASMQEYINDNKKLRSEVTHLKEQLSELRKEVARSKLCDVSCISSSTSQLMEMIVNQNEVLSLQNEGLLSSETSMLQKMRFFNI